MRKFLYFLLLIVILIGVYARYYEHRKLVYNEYVVETSIVPESFDSFKIVHFSDFLFPNTTDIEDLNNLIKKINLIKPDIIVFTGNLIDKNHQISVKNKNLIVDALKNLKPSLQKIAIYGNHDLKQKEIYDDILKNSDFILLDDISHLLFYKDNQPIRIINYRNKTSLEIEDEYLDTYNIALIHKPDDVSNITDINHVYLAGHSLGGYINLFITDPLIKKNGANIFIKGKYKLDYGLLFVSSGIGTDNIKFRFMNYPSFNVYTIKKTT